MAGEGYGTTSIGTGGAQVVGSPTYNIEKYAQPLIQEQKQKAAKEAAQIKRNDKILGDLKGLSKVGSLRYGAAMDKFRGEIIEKAKKAIQTQDINDLLDLENSKLQFNTIMDLAKQNDAFRNNVGQQMLQGGNFWNKEFFDEYHNPLDVSKITKPEDLIGQMTIDRDNLSEIRKDTHNPVKFRNDMEATAKEFLIRPEGFTEDDLKGTLAAMFTSDLGDDKPYNFDAYKHYEIRAKQDKALMDKFGGDAKAAAMDLAFNDYKYLLGKLPPKQKGGITINVGGGDEGNVTEGVITEQTRPIGAGGRNVDVRAFLYPKPVDLGARTQAEKMFKIDTRGNTVPVTANTPPVSYNETIEAPVSTVDVEWTGRDGKKRSIKKGQIVDPQDARDYAVFFTGQEIPTELALLSFGYDKDNNKYYEPAERIAPSSVASFYGAKGATAKSQYTKEGIEKTPSGKNKIPKALQNVSGR